MPPHLKVPGEYTTHERWERDCASFQELKGKDWYINQEVEPETHDGKSVLARWLDTVEKDGIRHVECCVPLVDQADDWCHKTFPRLDRAVVHVRNHLEHKPYLCGGYPDCAQEEWYVKNSLHVVELRFSILNQYCTIFLSGISPCAPIRTQASPLQMVVSKWPIKF